MSEDDRAAPRASEEASDRAITVAMARDIGLDIAGACLPGVLANRALLRRYADLVHGFALPDTCEPAFDYRP